MIASCLRVILSEHYCFPNDQNGVIKAAVCTCFYLGLNLSFWDELTCHFSFNTQHGFMRNIPFSPPQDVKFVYVCVYMCVCVCVCTRAHMHAYVRMLTMCIYVCTEISDLG